MSTPAGELLRKVRETRRPVVLAEKGREVAVVVPADAFKRLRRAAARSELRRAVKEAEKEVAEGKYVEHEEVLSTLRRWAAGEW